MTSPPPRTLSSRERIVEAARDEVLAKGILGLRVQDVATKAHVSVPLIYKYFDDRDGVLAEVLGRMFEELVLEYVEVAEEQFAAIENPTVEDFIAVFARPTDDSRRARRWMRVQIMAASMEIPALRQRLSVVQSHINDRTTEFMKLAQERIAGKEVMSSRVLALMIQSFGFGFIFNDLLEPDEAITDDEHVEALRTLVTAAFLGTAVPHV